MFARGLNLAPPEVRARRKRLHVLEARSPELRAARVQVASTQQLSVSIASFVTGPGGPGIGNQGEIGGCVGFAMGGGIATFFAAKGSPIALPAQVGIYKIARCIALGDPSQAITDSGTEPDAAVAAMQEWGISSAETWGDAYAPPDPARVNVTPTQAQLEGAASFKVNGAYFLQDAMDSDQLIIDLMAALAAGYPVMYSLPASGSVFQNYGGGVLTDLSGPIDHENFIVGCSIPEPGAYSQAVITSVNSWTAQWGEGGLYRLGRTAISQCSEPCVLDLVATGTES